MNPLSAYQLLFVCSFARNLSFNVGISEEVGVPCEPDRPAITEETVSFLGPEILTFCSIYLSERKTLGDFIDEKGKRHLKGLFFARKLSYNIDHLSKQFSPSRLFSGRPLAWSFPVPWKPLERDKAGSAGRMTASGRVINVSDPSQSVGFKLGGNFLYTFLPEGPIFALL